MWWSIYTILKKRRPEFVLLENVPRLLTSPKAKKGRDFNIILSCLNDLGYLIEWKVINASDYGFPQSRKRVYIICYKRTLITESFIEKFGFEKIILEKGIHKCI